MSKHNPTRRSLLKKLFGVSLLAGFSMPSWAKDWLANKAPVHSEIAQLSDYPQSAFYLGQRILADHTVPLPREWQAGASMIIAKQTSVPEKRKALAEQIHDDFMQGNTLVVDGWVLSKTEASLCALIALES